MQNGGGMVGHEGVDVGDGVPAVRAGLVSRQERGGGGGGDGRWGSLDSLGLACTVPLAAAGDGVAGSASASASRSERRQEAAAAAGASRGAAWAARLGMVGTSAGCLGGVGGVADNNEGLEPRLRHDLEFPDEKPAPLDKGEGVGNSAVGRIGLDLVNVLEPDVEARQLPQLVDRDECVLGLKKGTHLTLGMTIVLTTPSES